MAPRTSVHWFRKGLRIHDNPALIAAVKAEVELRPIFILDPWIVKKMRIGPNRWRFLQQCLLDLDNTLRSLGSRLYVIRGKPEEVFPKLFKEWNVQRLTFEVDFEPYAIERDRRVTKIALEADIEIIEKATHTLYNPMLVVQSNLGKPPLTFQKTLALLKSMGPPPKPIAALDELPPASKAKRNFLDDKNGSVPTLQELNVDETSLGECKYLGGETEGLARLKNCLARKKWVCEFEKPKTSPNSLEPSTTVLSPYLKFGCVSARRFYQDLMEVYRKCKHSEPPVSLLGQLYWREFYYIVGSNTPNFDKMVGNPICCQVDWDNNPEMVEAWAEGETGYPFIDAIMRQLRQEGWIHHLARHAVACFLTRGDLYQSWEEGQKVFEELLLDADWALNAGNWMWLSASAFFHQFFRVYSPVAFGKKTDPRGDYIRKYVHELKNFPVQYIYEPWKASLAEQRKAGCIVGQNYPHRIVIHEEVYKKNISRMSAAYKSNKMSQETERDKRASTSSSPSHSNKKKKTQN